jgi:hypothetical protein
LPSRDKPLFVPEDFIPMKEALEEGRAVIISAHNQTFSWQLPKLSGYASIYLSEIVPGSVIVPVSVEVAGDTPSGMTEVISHGTWVERVRSFFSRPAVHVHIHEPFTVPPLPNLARFEELAARQGTLSEAEHEEYKNLREARRAVGGMIMQILASTISPAKRGHWGSETSNPQPEESSAGIIAI